MLFGHALDEDRYWEVLRACALDQDVQQLHDSDLTNVGDRGAALSGGQQARLALARAIYQVGHQKAVVRDLLSCQIPPTCGWSPCPGLVAYKSFFEAQLSASLLQDPVIRSELFLA